LNRTVAYRDAGAAMDAARSAFARGDLATAERLCVEVLASPPQDGRAWALLTETALQRERLDAAIVCANRAVALLPDDPIAHILQAKCLILSGELGQALKAAERASETGRAPEALDALGAIFGMLGQHSRAAELFRRAIAARPDVPQYLVNLAATERMLGLLADADTHCRLAIDQNPGYALAHYIRSDLQVQSADRNHITEMESRLEAGGLDWRSTVLLRYAVGKECEDVAAHERAFAHVAAGARVLRQHVDYDVRTDVAAVDRAIATQNRSWLAGLKRERSAAAPVFVCGLPRTGTTLVERIIAAHSAVASVGETGVFPAQAARALGARPTVSAPDFDGLGERYLRIVSEVYAPAKRLFVDKTLHNYLHCGLIHAALPQAKIILMLRGPMATAWALYKAHFQAGYLFSYDLADLADYYLAYRRLVEHWKDILPSGTLMTVRYEDVVHSPAEQSARILGFLGLPWEEATLRFHESQAPSATASAVQVRRPIYADSIDAWRHHARSLAPFRDRLLKSSPALAAEDSGPL
jgi:tetratricopeptide (TPR) repeat protein